MTDREREGNGREAGDDRSVEITRRGSNETHDDVVVGGYPGGHTFHPFETTEGDELEAAQGGLLVGRVTPRTMDNPVLDVCESGVARRLPAGVGRRRDRPRRRAPRARTRLRQGLC